MAPDPTSAQYVSPASSRQLLALLEQLPGEPQQGFFGPGSVTWRVNRESVVFLGAGRAALLQLAHPWVAAALAQHSNLLHDAVGRFHSTFRVIYTMLFGTRTQALEAAKHLYQRHTSIRGELPHAIGAYAPGEHYEANEVAALRWVYATLVESAMLAYEFVLPPLSPADREQYYAESKQMAALFGIP
ncbi:MAG TPA: oxygenase MpaB family protein, partial [Acidobacteriaceae bacterium]|nr:oxygenase MpaB family protein [Acidobacteriaceae bacterium]